MKKSGIISRVGVMATYDKVKTAKPDPGGLEIIASYYSDIDKENMLMIGDLYAQIK